MKLDIIELEHSNLEKDFKLFLTVGFMYGIANGIYLTTFNNFLSDVYHLSAQSRGMLELPREIPGVLIFLVLTLISFLGDIRMAAIGMLLSALGMIGIGLFSKTYAVMLGWMMMVSLGTHIFMPLAPGIGMRLSQKKNYGMRLGQFNAYSLAATIIGYAIVWFGFKFFSFDYIKIFLISAFFFVLSALILGLINHQKPNIKKVQFILRKKYILYYCLSIVNGARKQIFLTFAPWVLIQSYQLDPTHFAILGLIISTFSIITRTIVGNAIDFKGERFVLSLEAILLIIICMGYAFAADVAPMNIAMFIIIICYILDNSMSAVEMARSTYVKKIAVHPDDVTPTLSAGISFDHVIAMSIPLFGGILWASFGYKYVFLCAAGIALINLILSLRIKIE
ncbi:MAG: MFS transporter [Desulfobacterales bacterium]|nr:MFS transporter [Desulfobacterales bacterium]MBF0395821.1 MFS transporter [Desulfobacterales bacterium]